MAGGVVNKGFMLGVKKTAEASSFTDIPDIQDFGGGGGGAVDDVETTVWSSDGKEFRGGLFEAAESKVDFLYDPSNAEHEFIRVANTTGIVLDWELKVGTLGAFLFEGYVKAFDPTYGKRGETVQGSFTIKVSGVPEWVPADAP